MPGKSVFWNMHFKELFQLVYAQYGEMHHLKRRQRVQYSTGYL